MHRKQGRLLQFALRALVIAGSATAARAQNPSSEAACTETPELSALLQVPRSGVVVGGSADVLPQRLPTKHGNQATASWEAKQGALPRKRLGWNSSASDLVGVQTNTAGDFRSFLCNLSINVGLMAVSLVAFGFLRHRYPLVFCNNVLTGVVAKPQHPGFFFGWICDSLSLTTDEVEDAAGLDAAMLLEFCSLCVRILTFTAVPMLTIAAPLHMLVGGASADRLSRLGIGNVIDGHWLCWLHGVLVWYVVAGVEYFVLSAQHAFLDRRCRWLRRMPAPQSRTVLVEGIPPEFCSDQALTKKFQDMFGDDRVEGAVVVKHTEQLLDLIAQERSAREALHRAEFQWEKDGRDPLRRPNFHSIVGECKDSIDYYEGLKREASEAIAVERRRLADAAKDVNSSSAFVSFTCRRDQELALMVDITFDADEFVISLPPDPSDVIYADLVEDPRRQAGRELIGRACIVGLYFGFIPFVVASSQLTDLDRLARRFAAVRALLERFPSAAPFLDSLAAVLALKFFMMFLPTFLMLIFQRFFCLRASAWAQLRLQGSYFWFLAVFEIMVTSVGSSLARTTLVLLRHPLRIVKLLADSLPGVSHFYLNFVVFLWGTHALNLTRYVNLMKFLALRSLYKDDLAKELSEPEDQDWDGIGGRSARFTEIVVIALLFCNLSPLISVLALINFSICRMVYGYLLVFAETRKPDLGGHFWVSQLDHLQKGLLIYCFTMVGVLLKKARSRHPAFLAMGSIVCWALCYSRFNKMHWTSLPLQELTDVDLSPRSLRKSSRDSYVQPELRG